MNTLLCFASRYISSLELAQQGKHVTYSSTEVIHGTKKNRQFFLTRGI